MPTSKERERAFIRAELPYGCWTLEDGGEVLFNRHYLPLYERRLDGSVIPRNHTPWPDHEDPKDPERWVPWKSQRWFYDDGTSYPERRRIGEKVLKEWGL